MRRLLACVAASAALVGCESQPTASEDAGALRGLIGTYAVVPIEMPGVPVHARDVNASGTVVGYSGQGVDDQVAFRWQNGVFTTLPFDSWPVIGINDLGDIVGALGGEPRIMFSDSAFSSRLFRADTTLIGAFPFDVNNAREVVIRTIGPGASENVSLWRGGQHSRISLSGSCSLPVALNERGVVLMQSQCSGTYDGWYAVPTRATGSSSTFSDKCSGHRMTNGIALNDSSDVIQSYTSIQPGVGAESWQRSGGCTDIAQRFPGLSLHTLNNRGVLAGRRILGADTSAVVALEMKCSPVDALLAFSGWHIVDVTRILDSGLMLGAGYRRSDGRTVAVLLVPGSA